MMVEWGPEGISGERLLDQGGCHCRGAPLGNILVRFLLDFGDTTAIFDGIWDIFVADMGALLHPLRSNNTV